ncbi:hypothetical protein G7054_g4578 [Neopestalotiopsis clavispora]|nr:hypothetical protein G7054_g4578 [Neopestalotiopsis clavispora]
MGHNAQTEAQSVGKSPALCEEGSAFQQSIQECLGCIQVNNPNSTDGSSYVSNAFQQYITYCNISNTVQRVTATISLTAAGGQVVPWTTITADITITGGVNATGASTSTPNTISTSTLLTSANSTVLGSPTSASNSNLIPTAEPTESANPGSGSKAWMAGPVVGSIAGVLVLAIGAFLWYRRRMARRKPISEEHMDKPQLHSDCVPRPLPDELDAGMRHELPGDEARDQKVAMSELPTKDPRSQDRTYGMSELP